MSFIKKYWTHFISIIFLIIVNLLFLNFKELLTLEENNFPFNFFILFMLMFLFVIVIWVEIVGFIIHAVASKDNKNKVIDAILIYLLNVYYIPCYYLKQIVKDTKLAIHNTIYIIISVFLSLTMLGSMLFGIYQVALYEINYQDNNQYQTVVSKDEFVKFEIPYFYKQEKVGDYDLYFSNKESIIGVYLYNNEGLTKEELIKYHDDFFTDTRDNVTITNTRKYNKQNKAIISHTLRGKKDGSTNIYLTNVITFDEYPEYVIYVVEICLEEDYDDYKPKFEKIIDDISLNIELDVM